MCKHIYSSLSVPYMRKAQGCYQVACACKEAAASSPLGTVSTPACNTTLQALISGEAASDSLLGLIEKQCLSSLTSHHSKAVTA